MNVMLTKDGKLIAHEKSALYLFNRFNITSYISTFLHGNIFMCLIQVNSEAELK